MANTFGTNNSLMSMSRPGTNDPAYLRKQALSAALMKDATSYRPAYSWGEALARALEGGVVGIGSAMEESTAKKRDIDFQTELSKALAGTSPGQKVSQALGGSANPDVKMLSGQFGIQESMSDARRAAIKPIMDASGKYVIGQVDADGNSKYLPAAALPTALQAEVAAAKAQATLPYDTQKARAGAANVSVKVEGEGRGELAKLGAKNFMTYQDAAKDADRRSIILDQYETLSKGFQTGATADLRLRAKQIAKDIFGVDVGDGDVATGEALKSAGRLLELAATPKGQGQITENERVIIREQMPQLLNTPGGNSLIISALRRLDEYDRKAAAVLRQVARDGSGYVDPVRAAEELAKLGPALPPDLYAAISGTRGGQQAAPPQAAPPQPAPQVTPQATPQLFPGSAPGDAPSAANEPDWIVLNGKVVRNPRKAPR